MKPPLTQPVTAVLVLLAALAAAPAATSAATSAAARAPKLKSVTLAIRSRVFHEFADKQEVVQGKSFPIGDTDFSARIVQYIPDFAMEIETKKVVSRSTEPRNPAFKLIVFQNGKPQDTTWAMMSLPPHFTRKSFLAFKVMRIDFTGREPIVADSVAAVKELEALKEAARRSRPTEAEASPHGSMGLDPHAGMPRGKAGASPHGATSPGTSRSPHGGTSIPITPSHGSRDTTATKDAK